MSKPYHLTVVELPSKYPGTLFGIHDARTDSLQSDNIGGKVSVSTWDIREHAQSEIGRQRHAEAVRAMLAALEASLHLVEKADADSGCMAFMERAEKHRAAIAAAKAAGIKTEERK